MAKNPFKFGTDLWDPSHRFQTSWLVSPYVLFATRVALSLYAFVVILTVLGLECENPTLGGCAEARDEFSYFTVLTYWGLAFYHGVSAFHTFSYARWGVTPLERWPRPLQALHALFYTTVTTFPFVVTIVFWSLLSSPATLATRYSAWSNISQHGLNSAYALFEIIVPRTNPPPWVHIFWLIVLLALYLALAYLTFATKGFYTYDFLDPRLQGAKVAAYVFGIGVGIVIIFVFVWGLIWLRKWITEKKLGLDGKFAEHRGNGSAGGRRVKHENHEMENTSPDASTFA
ncbi:hypothetical protein F5Y16DRAFT_383412 [Xylariaceae sp. FL0255]|nr:hypothetical protein F5Y16DRAFT_383412 [Xylariaceae sp. FL0255]